MSRIQITRETLLDGTLKQRHDVYAKAHPDMGFRSETEMEALLEQTLAQHPAGEDLWLFGYGSLIWNPAFHYEEKRCALLQGWHRSFCLKLFMGRGTPEKPGLMLALEPGGACCGVAFRIAAKQVRQELWLLWQREMFGGSYDASWVGLEIGAQMVKGLTFVINPLHPRYVKGLSMAQTAQMILEGQGELGSNLEYFENTVTHLRELGIEDATLARIAAFLPSA